MGLKCHKKTRKILKVFFKLCQNHKKSACFSAFAFKSTNFAQILKKIAQMCILTSSTFRSSALIVGPYADSPELSYTTTLSYTTLSTLGGDNLCALMVGPYADCRVIIHHHFILHHRHNPPRDKLRDHSGGAAQPLHSGRKAAPQSLTALQPVYPTPCIPSLLV